MERILNIDLNDKDDFYEKYNRNIVSKNLINYMIEELNFIGKSDTVKVVINNNCCLNDDSLLILKTGIELEYKKNLNKSKISNIKQVILMLIGILFLFLSTMIREGFIFKEVFLIIGWVPIWEVIDIELFSDVKEKRKRMILKKLLESNFEIVNK